MQEENQNLFSWKVSEEGVPRKRERSIVIVYVQPQFCSGPHSKYLIYIFISSVLTTTLWLLHYY